jgi:peptidylprolyl isomerase/peptidyl-prolyl cis-trans isomerase C
MNVPVAFRSPRPMTGSRASAATLALAIMLAGGSAPARSEPADHVVAIVNGNQIHESDIEVADEIVGRNLLTREPIERHETLVKMTIDTILLAQEAKNRNIEDKADLARRETLARNQGLMTNLLTVVGQQAVTEAAMRKVYEEVVVKGAATNQPEVHLRHIVFLIAPPNDEAASKAAEDKARAAMEKINKGEDFTAVVAEMSEDPVTKARGGDFDWRMPGEMGKEYADVAYKLKKGEVSAPFKTAVGWHIVKLEDIRPRKVVEYDKIRDRLAALVANAAQIELVDKLRAEAKIERPDQAHDADKGTVGRR